MEGGLGAIHCMRGFALGGWTGVDGLLFRYLLGGGEVEVVGGCLCLCSVFLIDSVPIRTIDRTFSNLLEVYY